MRQILFLAVYICIAFKLRRWSLDQDATTDAAPTRKARTLSGPGLVVYGLLGTFASVDWVLSLEKQWSSTMFGVILLIGQILTAFAFLIILLGRPRTRHLLRAWLTEFTITTLEICC